MPDQNDRGERGERGERPSLELQAPVAPSWMSKAPATAPVVPAPPAAPAPTTALPAAVTAPPAASNGHHPGHHPARPTDQELGFIPAVESPEEPGAPSVAPPGASAAMASASHSDILSTPLSAPVLPPQEAPSPSITLPPELEAALSATVTATAEGAITKKKRKSKKTADPPPVIELYMPEPESIPEDVLIANPPKDLICAYGDYADGTELPRAAHEWVMFNFISAMLNGQGNTFWNGSIPYSFDMWSIMLSTSGTGRSTLVGTGLSLTRQMKLKLEHDSSWGSGMGMIQTFADQPWGLCIFGEFSVLAGQLNKPAFGEAKQWLTDRYDAAYAPGPMKYRNTYRDTDTPEILFPVAPRTNLLCTSSIAWFHDNMDEEDTTGGFIPRFVPRRFADTICVPRPPRLDQSKVPSLLKGLYQISQIRHQTINLDDYPDLWTLHDEWFRAADKRFRQHEKSNLAKPFWGRMRGWMLKFALIYEVATSGLYQFTRASMERAIAEMSVIESDILAIVKTGMTKTGATEDAMYDVIYRSGVAGVSKSDLTRRFQNMKRYDRRDCWLKLLDSERVTMFSRAGKTGRPGYIFVDSKLEAEHARTHIGDALLPDAAQEVKKW